jgi:hypothetical protein
LPQVEPARGERHKDLAAVRQSAPTMTAASAHFDLGAQDEVFGRQRSSFAKGCPSQANDVDKNGAENEHARR